ncbi:MAG: hypothetical protein IJ344_02365, partial [Clostridia bacterium]|nr:hypothetical protein [Clostridia bacterium]
MRNRKFLLFILIFVILLFITACYLVYASLLSDTKDLKFPFFEKETTQSAVQSTVTTTADVTTEPEKEDEMYFISFYSETNWLGTTTVKHGEIPVYTGKTPTKAPDDKYIYVFSGWSESFEPAFENKSYLATFEKIERTVKVTFKDSAGKLIEVKTVPYKGSVQCSNAVEGYRDEQYEYVPIGWTKTNGYSRAEDLSCVTSDLELYPAFEKRKHSSRITFADGQGNVLQSTFVEIGTLPKYEGPTPTKESDQEHHYKFVTWDHVIMKVTEDDMTYTALFAPETRYYSVKFVDNKTGKTVTTQVTY